MKSSRDDPSPEGFWDLREVADRSGLHPESILRGIREKRYKLTPHSRPAYRTNRKYFFRVDQVEEFCRWRIALVS